jgi:hypothetical protein
VTRWAKIYTDQDEFEKIIHHLMRLVGSGVRNVAYSNNALPPLLVTVDAVPYGWTVIAEFFDPSLVPEGGEITLFTIPPPPPPPMILFWQRLHDELAS